MPNSTPGPWHYEGHYILTDSEPQVVIAERVSEANRGLIASAPTLQAKIEALADALAGLVDEAERMNCRCMYSEIDSGHHVDCGKPSVLDFCERAKAALKAAGRIP